MLRIFSLVITIGLLIMGGCGGGGTSDSQSAGSDQTGKLLKPGVVLDKANSNYSGLHVDWTWDLIAGQNKLAGTVHVYNDATTLYVVYQLTGNWKMTEAHVYAGLTPPDPKGAPGQFPYSQTWNGQGVSSYTFEIPLSDIDAGPKDTIYIAVHAAANGETLWGGRWNNGSPTFQFSWSKKWGGYFSTIVMPVFSPFPMTYTGVHGITSYFLFSFTNPPVPGWTPWPPNPVPGWCVDPQYYHDNNQVNVTVYSSYDPALPSYMRSDNWDIISWMINERYSSPPTNLFDTATAMEFQDAVWYFKYGTYSVNTSGFDANTWTLISLAVAGGENYIPGPGQYFACILWPGLGPGLFGNNPLNPPTQWQTFIVGVDP